MYRIRLDNTIAKALKPALLSAQKTIEKEIKNGVSELYSSNSRELVIVTRAEGSELVIVAVVGRNLAKQRDEIVEFAKVNGFKSIRFHTRFIERLEKGLFGVNYELVKRKKRLFSNDELIFRVKL